MRAGDAGVDAGVQPGPVPPGVPEGFKLFGPPVGFIEVNGPLYVREDGRGFTLGFRVEPRHCNPMGICHGGMLATFADMLLPIGAILTVPQLRTRFLPTVSLQIDYIGPARLGAWVEGEMQVLRTARTLVFADGHLTSEGEPIARCSGVFKIGPENSRPPQLQGR